VIIIKLIQNGKIIIEDNFGKLFKIEPNEKFNFGYILFIPKNINKEPTLIVEGLNTGTCSEYEKAVIEIYETAVKDLKPGRFPFFLSQDLGYPIMIPLFPRTYVDNKAIYTHALSSDTLKITDHILQGIDLQLIEMIESAKQFLLKIDIKVKEKIIIDGFSASGKFANRFTLLHPHIVKICIAGGVGGAPTLPIREYDNKEIIYPIGMYDILDFDFHEFSKVAVFYYMGQLDENDSSLYETAYKPNEKNLLDNILGENMMPDKWEKSKLIHKELNLKNIRFKTYTNYGHTRRPVLGDVIKFIKESENIIK
jgi:hypothetical protein